MARKSEAALKIVTGGGKAVTPEPTDLSPAELALWRDIVESKPAGWFGPDSQPLLKEYVRALAVCDLLDAQIKKSITEGEADQVKFFMDMRDKESRRAVSLATKMRLTQQSRYTDKSAGTADRRGGGRRPWE